MKTYKRATTEEDKQIVIDRLFALWMKYPSMRLSQLILNVYYKEDFYREEDFDFIQTLEEYYDNL